MATSTVAAPPPFPPPAEYDVPQHPAGTVLPPRRDSKDERRGSAGSIRRKPVPTSPTSPSYNRQSFPLNDIDEMSAHAGQDQNWAQPNGSNMQGTPAQYQQQLPNFDGRVTSMQSTDSRDLQTPSPDLALTVPPRDDPRLHEPLMSPSYHPTHVTQHTPIPQPQAAVISSGESNRSSGASYVMEETGRTDTPASSGDDLSREAVRPTKLYPQLQYHHQQQPGQSPNGSTGSVNDPNGVPYSRNSDSPASSEGNAPRGRHLDPAAAYRRPSRPMSSYSTLSVDGRGRSPGSASPHQRAVSAHQPYDNRRASYLDLTQPAHLQQGPGVSTFDNSHLQASIGNQLSLLSNKQTLEMYKVNAKKTNDPSLQYDLAVFMIQLAQQQGAQGDGVPPSPRSPRSPRSPKRSASGDSPDDQASRKELLRDARALLEKLQSRMPQAQYYLADAYASGLFNKGKEENDKAFPLFVAASKHGHAEAGYRAALCYEFGWGCRKDPAKAVQFYRAAASKNHPGAMTRLGMACLRSDLGLSAKYKEGVKWLKRATDVADEQYPSAPYELGLLHETGFGEDVFHDPSYSAQLFTEAARLGHADASFRMGEAYEHGKLNCPRDAALSVHFYTEAAQRGHPGAMMALCAWYLVGAEPVLEKNEEEAYIWALKASELGLPKAEYARGYFTEMGIGCRRDPLEANVWYVRAADHGDERAIARLKVINEAASGGNGNIGKKKKAPATTTAAAAAPEGKKQDDDPCCIM